MSRPAHNRPHRLAPALLPALILLACADDPISPTSIPAPTHDERTALVDHALWTAVEADHDPLPSHRPEPVDCLDAAWKVEDNALEVSTDACNYLALSQPSLTWITAGERLTIVGWSQQLFAEEPAQAHIAVAIGDQVVWEERVDVPGPAATWTPSFDAPFDAPEGTPIHLHLHNHGANTWYVLLIAVGG